MNCVTTKRNWNVLELNDLYSSQTFVFIGDLNATEDNIIKFV